MEKKDAVTASKDAEPIDGFQNVGRHADNVIDLAAEARKRRFCSLYEADETNWW